LEREEQQKLKAQRLSAVDGLTNPRVLHLTLIYLGMMIGGYAVSSWMPQVIKSLSKNYSNSFVGFLAMIPYAAALAGMILVGRSSDRRMERRAHVAVLLLLGGAAFVALSTVRSPILSVALFVLVAVGYCSALSPFWALPSEFLTGFSAASGIALINSVGNLGGFIGPSMIGFISQKTGSLYGGLAFAGICMVLSAILAMLLPRKSHARTPAGAEATL
jgi:ACS family tartrate transporter-like MFS transporter